MGSEPQTPKAGVCATNFDLAPRCNHQENSPLPLGEGGPAVAGG